MIDFPSSTSSLPTQNYSHSLSNKNDKIFAQCLNQAELSNLLFRHGCIATCGGKIIAKGCNTYKNYSSRDMFLNNCCSCHAEINVLRKIYHNKKQKSWKLNKIMKKTTLYISRFSHNEKETSKNSAPCIDCLNMIKRFNIKKIIFNMNDQYYVLNTRDYHTTHKCVGQSALDRLTNNE